VTVAVTNPGPLTGSLAAAYTYLTLPPPPPVSSRWNAGNTILGLVHTRDSTYIVLSNRDPAVTQTFLYDMDRKLWFENTMGIVAMTEELYSGSLTFFYGTSDGVVHQGFTATPPNYGNTPRVQTIFMNPPGKSREDWAVLQGVHVYGTDAGLVVTAATDDASPVTLVPVVDPTNTLPQGVDDIFYAPQGAVPRGRLFRFTLSWPGSSPEAMAAFEALWSFATDQQGAGGVP
jgi:hypothetical protein